LSGIRSYRSGSYFKAIALLTRATEFDTDDTLSSYFLALSHFQIGDTESARDALRTAVELERRHPIPNWGTRMERIQGRARLWLESARREAGVGRS
jgi:Flp pilus assembly protein TadD